MNPLPNCNNFYHFAKLFIYLLLCFWQSELPSSTHHKPPLKLRRDDYVFLLKQSPEAEKYNKKESL